MPPVVITPTEISRDGVPPPAETNGIAGAGLGHSCTNDGRIAVLVRNSGAGSRSVTFVTPGTQDTQAVGDRIVPLTAAQSKYFGPFPPTIYGDTLVVEVEHAEIKLTFFHLPSA